MAASFLPRHYTSKSQKQHRVSNHRLLRNACSWKVLVVLVVLGYFLVHRFAESSIQTGAPRLLHEAPEPHSGELPTAQAPNRQSWNSRQVKHESTEHEEAEHNDFEPEHVLQHQIHDQDRPQSVPHEDALYEHQAQKSPLVDGTGLDPVTGLASQPNKAFGDDSEYSKLVAKAATLPDAIMIPFVEAVSNDRLEGWEFEWVANGTYDVKRWGPLNEPGIDFLYTWVNGSDDSFRKMKMPYELASTLNDPAGKWRASHGSNRYRDWNELRFSLRSLEEHAPFRNRIQMLVNTVVESKTGTLSPQQPDWLSQKAKAEGLIEVLGLGDFFEESKLGCLPTFNSLTIENQIHNTRSEVDTLFALSDDMLLGKPHAASDIYSKLYGPMIGFKSNSYSTTNRPTQADAERFGEKPWLIYTSWLLNQRFGARKRKGMVHFGHAISRRVMAETMRSFPGPELQSACSRFRGDFSFQLYSWYATFHYTMERHREVLLWSYLMVRADEDGDGYLSWQERKKVLTEIIEGHENEPKSSFRARNFYTLPDVLEEAGLEPPLVNFDILWTSQDGPSHIKDIDCFDFNINECLALGFTTNLDNSGGQTRNPAFSTAAIFDRVARQRPECGDCLTKILLHRVQKGLSPLMPDPVTQRHEFELVTKALMRYHYVVHEPDALFVMVTDTEQIESTLIKRFKKKDKLVGQLCLNDDVSTEDETELEEIREALSDMYMELFPKPSSFEESGQP